MVARGRPTVVRASEERRREESACARTAGSYRRRGAWLPPEPQSIRLGPGHISCVGMPTAAATSPESDQCRWPSLQAPLWRALHPDALFRLHAAHRRQHEDARPGRGV